MNMNKLVMSILFTGLLALGACARVEPGHVGIKVNTMGSGAGVSGDPLGVGYYYAGPGTSIYEYPVFTSTYTWTRNSEEGSNRNEEFTFQDKSGLSMSADVAMAFRVDERKAPILFQKYRTDAQGIVSGPLRTAIRNAIVNQASNYTVEEIYGAKKAELIAKAHAEVQKYFEPYGLVVEQLYWASSVRVPKTVLEQINMKISNEQQAQAAQAAVATAEANARAAVAKAEGKAKAMQIEAEAIARNPQILQLRAIEKWDGSYPTYVGGGMPLPTVGIK